jgi:uncharacterized protein YndB with AHSA1/START domain
VRLRHVALALVLLAGPVHATPDNVDDVSVSVRRDGPAIVVDVDFVVDATPQQAWDVLTDYDHMSQFVSSLSMSRIDRRTGNMLEVAQTSRVSFGLFEFKFDNVRDVELVPLREIRSTIIRGDMRESTFTTRLGPEGTATRITNHGRFIPDRWIPPVVGTAMMKSRTRVQFAEIRAEILRRKALSAPGSH